ncbi:ABC transporter permease [uncultured Pseudodesulfovibrio sp.]|uniref:ABC transporter permease n=1 Tax=uncultured Pseudodesulfovibrio sp. TaxID=2035858 RepID=UPI0029C65BBC|nr:ABC transporter permease [uncultured Pseudodesulfovibrio sp.]
MNSSKFQRTSSAESSLKDLRGCVSKGVELRMAFYMGWRLFIRDVKARYRKTMLGYLWAVLPAVGTTLTFIFLNSAQILNAGETGIPYPIYAFIGALFWRLTITSVTAPMETVQSNLSVMSKVYFPPLAPLISSVLLTIFDFFINLSLAPVVMYAFGTTPGMNLIFLPLIILLVLVFGISVGIFLTPINMLFQDTRLAVALLFSFLVLACPIGYAPAKDTWLGQFMQYNPFAWIIDAARASMTDLPIEHIPQLLGLGAASLVLLILASIIYFVVLPIAIERHSA